MPTKPLFLAAVLFFAAARAQTQPDVEKPVFLGAKTEWVKVEGEDRTFTVEVPPGRTFTSTAYRWEPAKGVFPPTRVYRVVAVPRYYEVHSTVYPPEIDCSDPKGFLKKVLDEEVKMMEGKKWSSVTWAKHQGLASFDAFGLYGPGATPGVARFYTVIRGQQVIAIHYYGPDGSGRDEAVNRIIDSLNIR